MPDADIDKLPIEIVDLAASIETELQDWFADWWGERQREFGLIGPDTEIEELEFASFEEEILSMARARWPLSHAERLAYAVFSWDTDWQSNFVRRMTPALIDGRVSGIRFALSKLGYQLPEAFSLRREFRDGVRDHVRSVAGGMRRAQQKWLRNAIDRVKAWWIEDYGSLAGLNRNNIASRLGRLESERRLWHVPLTGWTEAAWAFNQGVRDFLENNDPSAEVQVLPDEASDPARDHPPPCINFAGGWFAYRDLPLFPLHPDCVHYLGNIRFSWEMELMPVVDLGADERYRINLLEPV
jgi:hypothetical protein